MGIYNAHAASQLEGLRNVQRRTEQNTKVLAGAQGDLRPPAETRRSHELSAVGSAFNTEVRSTRRGTEVRSALRIGGTERDPRSMSEPCRTSGARPAPCLRSPRDRKLRALSGLLWWGVLLTQRHSAHGGARSQNRVRRTSRVRHLARVLLRASGRPATESSMPSVALRASVLKPFLSGYLAAVITRTRPFASLR